MRCLGAFVASLLLAACPGPGPDPVVDAGGDDDDGDVPGNGLTVTFALPTPFPVMTDTLLIDRIDMRARSVRAIGDAAPGDERTTRLGYRIRWDGSDAPEAIHFEAAPVGLYSSIDLQLSADGDGSLALEIEGECTRNGDRVGFDIESRDALAIAIAANEMLAPGGSASIDITVDLAAALATVDWDALPLDGDGDVAIDDGDAVMAQIVASVRASFTAGAPSQSVR